tara:strand:+ start:43541 stop:44428 length:888 start_codon:yes stop_codon:yes gene_type:complete
MIKNYILHLRPKSFIPSFTFALTGYAINPQKGAHVSIAIELLSLFFIYSVLLFGGTCALNTHFDNDNGPLNFLENPPEKPKYLGHFGIILMFLAVVLSSQFGQWAMTMAALSLVLSVLYSVKLPGFTWRGKEVGVIDNLINALGCGFVGVMMGATFSDSLPDVATVLFAISFTITVAGSYPATQIFQLKASDTYAVGRNFTTLLGPTRALKVGAALLIAGLVITDLTQILFFPKQAGFSSMILFFGFNMFFLLGVVQMYKWSRTPFDNTKIRYGSLIKTLLGARLLWIAAEWIIS